MKNNDKPKYNLLQGSAASGLGFASVLLLYLILTTIGGAILNACGVEQNSLLYTAIGPLFPIIAITVVLTVFSVKRKENIVKTVGIERFNPIYLMSSLLLAVGMLFGLGFLNNLIANTVIDLGGKVASTNIVMNNFWEFLLLVVVLAVLPAIFEESLFRGFMLKGIGAMSTPLAVLTVSLCFSLYHGNIAQLIYQLVYGVGLTILAIKSKSVVPSAIAHFLNNFIILLFTFIGVNIDLNAWYIILIGCISLALFALTVFYLFNTIGANKTDGKEVVGSVKEAPETQPYKKFWIPFGIFAVGILVMIIIAGVIG